MGFQIKKGANFALCPAGTWIARCHLVVDLGTQPVEWQGQKKEPKQQIRIGFEFPTLLHVFDEAKGKEPFTLSRQFTNTLGDKGTLKPILNSWRGRPFTEEDIKTFSFDKLLGATALITVVHEQKTDGMVAKIGAVVKAVLNGQPMQCPPAIMKPILYTIDSGPNDPKFKELPEWLRDQCAQCTEWANAPEDPGQPGTPVPSQDGQQAPANNDPF